VKDCGFTEAEGYNAMKDWISEDSLPSAVFAANDAAAIGAMAALHDGGLSVPNDVAIIGAGMHRPDSPVHWKTVREMGLAWIVTVPVAALSGAAAFLLLPRF
jgi:ABC-type sugar transport system substrate-binding protein